MEIKITPLKKEVKSGYGRTYFAGTFEVETKGSTSTMKTNRYLLEGELKGVTGESEGMYWSCIGFKALTNNEDTLSMETVCDAIDWEY